MYLTHFKLKERPFQLNTDPRFLWLGRQHQEALATLQHGVGENKGLMLLTGDIGTGKTTLISALVDRLDDDKFVVAKLPDPGINRSEFFFLVAHSFGINRRVRNKEAFTEVFEQFLARIGKQDKTALLIIDEAQIMSTRIIEEVRLLSNLKCRNDNPLNIFLVGQNELKDLLLQPQTKAFRERIAVSYNIKTLSADETKAYIKHRLCVAGATTRIFTDDAISEIHAFAHGSPRQINILCDLTLVFGAMQNIAQIDGRTIAACKEHARITKASTTTPPNVRAAPAPAALAQTGQAGLVSQNNTPLHIPAAALKPVSIKPTRPRHTGLHLLMALLIILPGCYLIYAVFTGTGPMQWLDVNRLVQRSENPPPGRLPPRRVTNPAHQEATVWVDVQARQQTVANPADPPLARKKIKTASSSQVVGMAPAKHKPVRPPEPIKALKASLPKSTFQPTKPPAAIPAGNASKTSKKPPLPLSETPDPADIIDWLIKEKRKEGKEK